MTFVTQKASTGSPARQVSYDGDGPVGYAIVCQTVSVGLTVVFAHLAQIQYYLYHQRVHAGMGSAYVQVGRATTRDAEFVPNLQRGAIDASDCDPCNRCIASMDAGGVYCVTTEEERQEPAPA